MLRPATMIIPKFLNDRITPTSDVHLTELARKIIALSGGLTLTEGTGMWVSPEGEEFCEDNYIFTFAVPHDSVGSYVTVSEIAQWAAEVFDQQAIYIDTPVRGVEFISRASVEAGAAEVQAA